MILTKKNETSQCFPCYSFYKDRIILITRKELLEDFENVMREILEFFGIEITDKLKNGIEEQSRKQKEFKSKHSYNLSDFGLTEERIERDFKFIHENYKV